MGVISFLTTLFKFLMGLKDLWDQFVEAQRVRDLAEAARKKAALDQAVDRQKNAKTEEEFDKEQDEIVNHLP